jgi:hypothetical protein
MKALPILAPFFLVTACSDGGGKKPTIIPDAPMQMIDAPEQPANCTLTQMATVTPITPEGEYGIDTMAGGATDYYGLLAGLNEDANPDILGIELYKDFGAFMANGFPTAPTTIEITGDEANYATCGACIRVYTDVTEDAYGGDYFATAGTLQLMKVSETQLAGTITNLTFTHVDIDDTTFTSTPHADGCTANLGSLAFDVVPTQIQDAFTNGRGGLRLTIRKRTR